MNKFYAVILAGCMISTVALPNAEENTPNVISRACTSVANTVCKVVSSVTTPVKNHPYISGTVALVAVAAIAYCLLNAEDNNEEEEAQF